MARQTISALDMVFLCLERELTPMHLGGVAVFGPGRPVDGARLVELIADRASRQPRLRLRVNKTWLVPGQAHWEPQPGFDAESHVVAHHLPSPGGEPELETLISELMSSPLDVSRPLWEVHVITGLEGGRFAVFVKLHHALADGASAVELGLGLLDGFTPEDTPPEHTSPPSILGSAASMLSNPGKARQMFDETLSAASEFLQVLLRPETVEIATSVLGRLRPAHRSPLAAPHTAAKRVDMVTLPRADLRRIKRRYGATTNDIVLTIVTGALRQWLATRGHPVHELDLRALIPAQHRQTNDSANNQLSAYLCDLPVHEPDPSARLALIQSSMRRNKSNGPTRGAGALPVLASQLPPLLHQVLTPIATHAAHLLFDTVITNVPLPDIEVSLDGARLHQLYPLVPLPAGHALSIAACPYRDNVHIGLLANRSALPDIEKLHHALPHALAELDDLAQ
ncbi:wax ester/triacylglycerol synthase family O-acyltransferase [Saccharopolyspora hattusasensis]|uniref:wax ester/triacylglycerol synthase family O-acyltransferase n=1 Tax=Saccharopolyspora hattusasensis TaxID=1128679 RepID=UPI003D97C4E3